MGFPGGSAVKNLPASAGDSGLIPGSRRSSEEGNGNPPSILAWEFPWREEPGRLYSPWGHKRVGHDLVTKQQQRTRLRKVRQVFKFL